MQPELFSCQTVKYVDFFTFLMIIPKVQVIRYLQFSKHSQNRIYLQNGQFV